jgi:hypothetical protein
LTRQQVRDVVSMLLRDSHWRHTICRLVMRLEDRYGVEFSSPGGSGKRYIVRMLLVYFLEHTSRSGRNCDDTLDHCHDEINGLLMNEDVFEVFKPVATEVAARLAVQTAIARPETTAQRTKPHRHSGTSSGRPIAQTHPERHARP